MEKLKDLSQRFQTFLDQNFSGFNEMSLASIPVLNNLEDKIRKRRSIVNYHIVDSNSQELVAQIEQVKADLPNNQLAVVLDNAKTILAFKQKVLETNLRSYKKFYKISQDTLSQLEEFNQKASRLFGLEKAGSIDPRQILPNMFSVVKDFAANLEYIAESVTFLLYTERYTVTSNLSDKETQAEIVEAMIVEEAEALEDVVKRIGEHASKFSTTTSSSVEKLKAVNELRLAGKRLAKENENHTESYIFECICRITENLLCNVKESAKIYGTMYQLAETCFTAKFIRMDILEEHTKMFSMIRSRTEESEINSFLDYFINLSKLKAEVVDEIVFLNKLLDLTVETSAEDEELFYENYRDDILHNINQINGLLTAFGIVKDKLTFSEDLLKVEQERVSIIRELSSKLSEVEKQAQPLPPSQKNDLLLSAFGFFGETVIKHAELMEKASSGLSLFQHGKLKFENINAYREYLKNSHEKLKESRRLLYSRISTLQPAEEQIVQSKVQDRPTAVQSTFAQQSKHELDPSTAVHYKTVVEDDAFLLDYTMQLHESTKNSIDSVMNAQDRMDLAALLLYTSSGRNLTWSTIEVVFESWKELFGKQAVKDSQHALRFREQAHRIKSLIENHLESSGSNLHNVQQARVLYT